MASQKQTKIVNLGSVQFSRSVVSYSLRPHESQHARPPCPSQTPGVYSNSCPSSRWCHPAISSSVVPFSFCSQSLPALGSFPMSQLFAASLMRQRSCTMLHPPFSFCSPRTDVLQGLLHQLRKIPVRVFSNESTLRMRWPKYRSFSFSISPSNEHPGLISFRMDWLDLLAVQGTLKSLFQHHSSKAST